MTDYTDLIERLRVQRTTDEMTTEECAGADYEYAYNMVVQDCREAAAAIAALQAERDALRIAAQTGREYVSAAIEDWGVDDAHSQSMKADLAQIDAALTALTPSKPDAPPSQQ